MYVHPRAKLTRIINSKISLKNRRKHEFLQFPIQVNFARGCRRVPWDGGGVGVWVGDYVSAANLHRIDWLAEVRAVLPSFDCVSVVAWKLWREAWSTCDDDIKLNYFEQSKSVKLVRASLVPLAPALAPVGHAEASLKGIAPAVDPYIHYIYNTYIHTY